MVLDPFVLPDFSLKNGLRVFESFTGQILAVGHHAHAHPVVVLRDVPEPALVWDESHRGASLVDAGVPLGPLVISPHGNLVELGITTPPSVASGSDGLAPRRVHGDWRANLHLSMLAGLDPNTIVSAHAVLQQFGDFRLFPNRDAVLSGIVEHHLVELAAQDLPRLRHGFTIIPVEEIEGLRSTARRGNELHGILLHEARLAELRNHPDPLQRRIREGDHRLANMIPGKLLPFYQQDSPTVHSQGGRRGATSWTCPNDHRIVVFHRFHTQTYYFLE